MIYGDSVRRSTAGRQSYGASDAPDVIVCGVFAVECEHQKSINVRRAMQQACEAAKPGQVPVCHLKWQGGYEVVVVLVHDWFDLINESNERTK